ncbi:MtrAB system histidine kinase MtrB [Planctomonas psychrotolerans]|uniref:MtrAB system histidine kinase MtrB n=1 Tax=Planctomonas psychrotolerans TaxID=2528712 RepID=UPI001D0D3E70|nr:MtrAB system histidine kinase MtrB [Planctomonas psychrotolerans]
MTPQRWQSQLESTGLVDWRSWPRRVLRLWRVSLQFRTVVLTVTLSSFTILLTGGYMSSSIANDLFQSRLDTVLALSERATAQAQTQFDSAASSDEAILNQVRGQALSGISQITTGQADFALLGYPGGSGLLQNTTSRDFVGDVISPQLREQVRDESERLHYQSVSLQREEGGSDPGVVVGSTVSVPTAGNYELYLIYNLRDVQQTLSFVQGTIAVGGIALLALIVVITWLVVRLVVAPIRIAAETSQKLAAGQLEERIPEHGEDVITTLARSFNGMADSMQKQITQLADLSRLQQRFVSDVSHELRTPLTTIRLASGMLYDQRHSFEPSTARSAELLHTQTERFEILLADLLEISRFDAGAVQIVTEPTNLVRLAEDAVDELATLAAQKGSELRIVAPGGYFDAEIDGRRIRRIIINLLGNAIDHGEGRPIIVTVDSNETAVALSVRDYGVGMTQDQVDRVFDRFWRADSSRQRTTGGTGLGLAIASEDAILHGGWLEAWSRPGQGSCFRLTLPRVHGRPLTVSPLPLTPEDAEEPLSVDAGIPLDPASEVPRADD